MKTDSVEQTISVEHKIRNYI